MDDTLISITYDEARSVYIANFMDLGSVELLANTYEDAVCEAAVYSIESN